MTPAAIQSEIRSLTRQLKALRRKLPKGPAAVFKGQTRKQARKAKRETAAERRRRVYAEVDARSGGTCEVSWPKEDTKPDAIEHDHFFGRGKAPETAETVWHLCDYCHRNKTRNEPSRLRWIELFRNHCQRHGYAAQVAKCDAAIALEEAQHPEPARIEGKGRTT